MAWAIDHRSDHAAIHVYPLDDLRPHECVEACWCGPNEAEADEIDIPQAARRTVLVHNAMDERDSYAPEGGPRALH